MGGLNAARGACTVILSIERFTVTWGGSVIDAIEAQLKRIGVTVPANAVSTLCKNIHHFADDFVVGKREKELRDELALCSKKE